MCDPSSLSQDSSSKDSLQTHAEVSPLQQAGCLPFGKGAAEKQVCLFNTEHGLHLSCTVGLNVCKNRPWFWTKQGKLVSLCVRQIWSKCWGQGHKIKAVDSWSDFSSPLPTRRSVERSNVRIKARPRLDLHPSSTNAIKMVRCWNTLHLGEFNMRDREINPLEGKKERFQLQTKASMWDFVRT